MSISSILWFCFFVFFFVKLHSAFGHSLTCNAVWKKELKLSVLHVQMKKERKSSNLIFTFARRCLKFLDGTLLYCWISFSSPFWCNNFTYELFTFKGEDVNRTLEGGRKPLHYAADCGQLEILEFLLLKGADINVCTSKFIIIYVVFFPHVRDKCLIDYWK